MSRMTAPVIRTPLHYSWKRTEILVRVAAIQTCNVAVAVVQFQLVSRSCISFAVRKRSSLSFSGDVNGYSCSISESWSTYIPTNMSTKYGDHTCPVSKDIGEIVQTDAVSAKVLGLLISTGSNIIQVCRLPRMLDFDLLYLDEYHIPGPGTWHGISQGLDLVVPEVIWQNWKIRKLIHAQPHTNRAKIPFAHTKFRTRVNISMRETFQGCHQTRWISISHKMCLIQLHEGKQSLVIDNASTSIKEI